MCFECAGCQLVGEGVVVLFAKVVPVARLGNEVSIYDLRRVNITFDDIAKPLIITLFAINKA